MRRYHPQLGPSRLSNLHIPSQTCLEVAFHGESRKLTAEIHHCTLQIPLPLCYLQCPFPCLYWGDHLTKVEVSSADGQCCAKVDTQPVPAFLPTKLSS